MNQVHTVNTTPRAPLGLRSTLVLDAASCLLMGAGLLAFGRALSEGFGLPSALLFWAGLLLLPSAGLMLFASRHSPPKKPLVWLIIGGNLMWVAASLGVGLALFTPTPLGQAFVLIQAAFVLAMAWLEWAGLPRAA
jgi:hypothetical protein